MAIYKYISEVMYLLGTNKGRVPLLVVLFVISSLLDVIGIGLIGPYVSLLVNKSGEIPEILIVIIEFLGYSDLSYDQFLIYTGWVLVLVFLVKTISAIFINYKILSFCFEQGASLRTHLMKSYQHMPYEDYVNRNSSECIRNIDLAAAFSHGILQSILRFLSESAVTVAIVIFLAYQQPYILALLLSILMGIFVLYDFFFKNRVKQYGVVSNDMHKKIVKGVYEGIEGLKEIKILGKENYFYNIVSEATKRYASMGVKSSLISGSPRYLIEFMLVVFVVLLVFLFVELKIDNSQLLPLLSMFGLASIRLAPSANQMVSSISKMRFGKDAVSLLYKDLLSLSNNKNIKPLSENHESFNSIKLENVSYTFRDVKHKTLDDISLEINKGDSIGFIGSSGSGKTTLINIIAGLIEPNNGRVLYNGVDIVSNQTGFMSMIAYLPQQVFIIDDTILKNVALGETDDEIEVIKVVDAMKKAKLYDFVDTLPKGLNTTIGERGVRLSGGQRQRLALARAFYHNREVLIMDESTSSLDDKIEKEIIEEIKQLKGKITIIIIAHRLSTVKYCNCIYKIDKGVIIDQGDFEYIVNQ